MVHIAHCSISKKLPLQAAQNCLPVHDRVRLKIVNCSSLKGFKNLTSSNYLTQNFTFHRRDSTPLNLRKIQILCKRSRFNRDFDRDRDLHPYIVTVISPPPKSLGIHSLPKNVQCGETVEVEGESYVVSGVTYRYQLKRGSYEKSEKRLDVLTTSRYFLNLFLDSMVDNS